MDSSFFFAKFTDLIMKTKYFNRKVKMVIDMKKTIKVIGTVICTLIIILMVAFFGFLGFLRVGENMGFIKTEVKVTGINGTVVYDSDGISSEDVAKAMTEEY